MKLISFRGENIRGYQNHCINFRNGVTFLIGINGSGKTTVLNLIQGLLTPSLKILATIEYSYIEVELVVNQDMKKIVVSSTKSEDLIAISIAIGGQPPLIAEISRNKLNSLIEIEQDNITSAELPFVDDPFIQSESYKEIRKLIKTPLFISLDRVSTEQLNNIERRNIFAHRRSRNVVLNINDCLEAIQNNIYSLYRRNSTLQNQYIVEFRNQVVRTSLKFNNGDFSFLSQSRNLLEEKGKIEKKETDFLEAIKGLEMEDIIEEAQVFFKKLKEALNIMLSSQDAVDDKKRNEATITWILNNTQLLKVDEIIDSGHSYQQKMERLKAPISRFTQSVNLFFRESNKQLVISKTIAVR
jgi:putative enzyme with ATPase activity